MNRKRTADRITARIFYALKTDRAKGKTHDPRRREWSRADSAVADDAWKDLRSEFLRGGTYSVKRFFIARGGQPAVTLYEYRHDVDVPGLREMFYTTDGEWHDTRRTGPSERNL